MTPLGRATGVAVFAGLCAACIALSGAAAGSPPAGAGGFTFADKAGECLDVLLDGRIAARYMYAHDTSTAARRLETYKPYLHVFDADGNAPITKGAGGYYTHHRGIFIGWTKVVFNGTRYDLWGMGGGDIVHQKFLEQKADAGQATFTSLTHWNDKAGKAILEEERTQTVRRGAAPARLVIDFVSKLKASAGDVALDGDPEHAGVHYRPADEVERKETVYVFPKEGAAPTKDLDYPWVGETYSLRGKKYSVVEMNHPDNPKGTRFSAYRDYGRFGAFAKQEVKSGQTLTIRYRFLIADGEMPPAGAIQKCWDELAGVKSASPVPPVSVLRSAPQKAPTTVKAATAPAPPR